jgi:hypothetical protein
MNVNLHIDQIVLDGIDLAPGQNQLLQHAIINQLTTILARQRIGASLRDSSNWDSLQGNSIHLGRTADAATLGPQLADAIYATLRRSEISPSARSTTSMPGASS